MMRRRFRIVAVAAAAACTLVAGCGASSSGGGTNESTATPHTELVDSFRSLTAGSALTTTLSLDTTSANLIHLSGTGGSTPLTQSQADLLAGAKVVVETTAPSDQSLKAATAKGFDSGISSKITGSSGGTTYFTYVQTNKTFYLQVDLRDLLAAAGKSSEYQSLLTQSASMPSFAQAFLAGKYVSLPLSVVTSIESILKGTLQGAVAAQIPSAEQIRALVLQIGNTILSDLSVTRTSTGATDQLVATGNIRKIARDILTTLTSGFPALASQIDPSAAGSVPNRNVTLDASVTSGAISKLEFDVGQFSPHHKFSLPVAATFAKSSPEISVPSGAVAISLQDLIQFFTAIDSGTSSSGSGSGGVVMPVPSSVMSTAPSQ